MENEELVITAKALLTAAIEAAPQERPLFITPRLHFSWTAFTELHSRDTSQLSGLVFLSCFAAMSVYADFFDRNWDVSLLSKYGAQNAGKEKKVSRYLGACDSSIR